MTNNRDQQDEERRIRSLHAVAAFEERRGNMRAANLWNEHIRKVVGQ